MAQVSLANIKKSFGAVELFDGVQLEVASGEFVVFVGPSGSGKSTLLRMIAGLEAVSDGVIEIDGEDITFDEGARYLEVRLLLETNELSNEENIAWERFTHN